MKALTLDGTSAVFSLLARCGQSDAFAAALGGAVTACPADMDCR
jgi:hypothetical protein